MSRCLAKQPRERFQAMAEVKAALEQAVVKPTDQRPSIAVLPFANMSRDPDDEYFSDGLAEEIINALTHVPGLNVTARTSAFAFRARNRDIRKIGETLDVRTILEGSVRRAGSRIRVTAQLINAGNGYHLWSERYDRELKDVFAIQDQIVESIVSALRVRLGRSEVPAAARRHRTNVTAYQDYLRGLNHWYVVTRIPYGGRRTFSSRRSSGTRTMPWRTLASRSHMRASAGMGCARTRREPSLARR